MHGDLHEVFTFYFVQVLEEKDDFFKVRLFSEMCRLSHVGPLQLDKRFSSSQEVRTYFGLPVELRCAFKYGAEPVRVGIFRGDLIIAGQENGTKKVKISVGRKISDFGSYTCRAEDSKNQKLIYNIMLKKIDPSNISTNGKKVTCSRDGMQLTLDRLIYPWLQPSYFKMHLLDNRCYPSVVNETHIIVKTSFRECKTMKKNSSLRITYRNILMAFVRAPPGRVITRVHDVFFPFQCRFEHKKVASISTELNKAAVSYPSEALAADKARSTPRYVRSFKGFQVRLVCAFKGGVPPVNLLVLKGGRTMSDGVLVRGKYVFITVWTNQTRAFGSYDCVAKDAKGKKIKQRITLQRAGPHDINSDGLAVKCQSDRMDVTLSRLEYPWLDPSLLHLKLINSDCSAYNVTDSQVDIQIPLSRCGTRTRVKNKFVLESRNVVIIKAKRPPGVKVIYLPQIHFRIFCAYEMDRSRNEIALKGIEPLALDLSESSSNTVFSPINMTTKLRCVVQGGEPPIKLTLSRKRMLMAHAQGMRRSLGLLLRPSFQDGGRYVCKATDARRRTVTHVINLKVPVGGIIFMSGAEVDCGPQFTSVFISRARYPWFNPWRMRMHLNDPICKSSVSNTHVTFKFPLGACGSRHIISGNKVTFFNRVFIVNKPYHKFQKRIMELMFICRYRVMDSPGYKLKGFL